MDEHDLADLEGGATAIQPPRSQEARPTGLVLSVVEVGLIASGPTAIAGAGDWAEMSGTERRIGAVHALGTDAATFLLLGSLVARWRGRYPAGTKFALAGNLVMVAAGFLGGHLALNRGTARRTPVEH